MIVIPYVAGMLHHETARTPGGEFVQLPEDDPYAYWRLLLALYDHGQDFMIVEQDIIITQAQIDDINACPEPWCVYGYRRGTAEFTALGVLRLRSEVSEAYPQLLHMETPKRVYFDQCDGMLYSRLGAAGYKYHRHYPNVRHEQSAIRVLIDFKVCREPIDGYGSSDTPMRGVAWDVNAFRMRIGKAE